MENRVDIVAKVSSRGFPLITQDNKGKKMLTAEDYMKWYDLYLIQEDGSVEKVQWNEHFAEGWRDHCILPESFKSMAAMLGADYDAKTWKAVKDMYRASIA